MTNSEGQAIEEAVLYRALRSELPAADEMASRVRTRLAGRETAASARPQDRSMPKGVVLRLADWIGLRGVAASIVGPVLLPLGLARAGSTGTIVMKGLLPKGIVSTLALPFALLMVIGFTVQLSLRKTTKLKGEQGPHESSFENPSEGADEAVVAWWATHWWSTMAFAGLIILLNLASYPTAKMLLILAGLVAHALCAEALSGGHRASRRAVAMAALSIGTSVYVLGSLTVTVSNLIAPLVGLNPAQPEFHQLGLDFSIALLAVGGLTLATVQGRSHFLRPWRLMTEGTDRDLAKLAGLVAVVVAVPAVICALVFHLQETGGSLGEQLWASRSSLALFAFCIHAIVVVKRAPLVVDSEA